MIEDHDAGNTEEGVDDAPAEWIVAGHEDAAGDQQLGQRRVGPFDGGIVPRHDRGAVGLFPRHVFAGGIGVVELVEDVDVGRGQPGQRERQGEQGEHHGQRDRLPAAQPG